MIDQLPQSILAKVGPKVLAKSAELFDQSAATIVSELLQNARRAGASTVTITASTLGARCEITLHDDGHGIEDPQALLTFGGSGWDMETDYRENAAGMGFFSLASLGCSVESSNWRADITPAGFIGSEPVLIRANTAHVGTTVRFGLNISLDALARVIEEEAKFAPITVNYNGATIQRLDFLADALYTKVWRGLRFGVFGTSRQYDGTMKVNFYGHVIEDRQQRRIREVDGKELIVRVEVIDCPALRLVLPTRDKLVENAFCEEVREMSERVRYEYCASRPHQLPFQKFTRARALGVDVEEPTAFSLLAFSPRSADEEVYEYGTRILTPAGPQVLLFSDEVIAETNFAHADSSAVRAAYPMLRRPNAEFEGYQGYNALSCVREVFYRVSLDGETYESSSTESNARSLGDFEETHVDELSVVLAIEQRTAGNTGAYLSTALEMVCPTSVLIVDCDGDAQLWDENSFRILVRQGAPPTVEELSSMLVRAMFQPSDDSDADSYDTQRATAEVEADFIAENVLLSEGEIVGRRIRAAARTLLVAALPQAASVTIRRTNLEADGPLAFTVSITGADGSTQEV